MNNIRYFTGKGVNFLVKERAQGLRNVSKIKFMKGYDLAASTPQSILHSGGSQVESDFKIAQQAHAEWDFKLKPKSIDDSPGQDVPEVFREHRHNFSEKPADLNAYRRQLHYRCTHIGTKELEIVLGDWLTINSATLSYDELEQFDDQILDMENPLLQRYLLNGEDLAEEHDLKYVKVLREYVEARKVDYHGNVPKQMF